MNLNINQEKIKHCFKKFNGYISLEKFEKLILDEKLEDIISEDIKFTPTICAARNKKKIHL